MKIETSPETAAVARYLTAFLDTRCRVTAQHKLPDITEICAVGQRTYLCERRVIENAIRHLAAEGKIIYYGPYISDHPIEVL